MITALICLCSQDLWERMKEQQYDASRGRSEYRLGPSTDRRGGKVNAAKVDFDLATNLDFACGRFDLKASFGSLINKDIAGDLVGAALSELRDRLVGSGMVLACQMSPTLCDALKHFRVTANELLAQQFADCRAIEKEADGPTKTLRARALMACLVEKQRGGVPIDDALRDCKNREEVRGLDGKRSPEIDLIQQLGDAFKVSADARAILRDLLDAPKLGPNGQRGDVKLRAVDAAYEKERADAEARIRKGVESGKPDGVAPASLPPLTAADLDILRALDEEQRRNVIGVIAGAHALVALSSTVHEVQSLLEAAAAMADDPTLREAFERQSQRLERELRRLRDSSEIAGAALQTQAKVLTAVKESRDEKIRRASVPVRAKTMNRNGAVYPTCPEPICPTKGGSK